MDTSRLPSFLIALSLVVAGCGGKATGGSPGGTSSGGGGSQGGSSSGSGASSSGSSNSDGGGACPNGAIGGACSDEGQTCGYCDEGYKTECACTAGHWVCSQNGDACLTSCPSAAPQNHEVCGPAMLTCAYPPGGGCGEQCTCSGGAWSCVADPCTAPPDAGPPDAAAAAELCAQTGGTVVQTYSSANPPFAQYTCASGDNGGVCDPGPGEPGPMTPECVCGSAGSTTQCFDPVKGCVASM